MRLPCLAFVCAVLSLPVPGSAEMVTPGLAGIEVARLKMHIDYLASDALEGRLTGEPGCERAAGYIAEEMRKIGLEPMGDNGTYYDHFSFTNGTGLGAGNICKLTAGSIETVLTPEIDWMPMFFSPNADVEAPVVFAGYGISAPQYKYDDYKDLNVRGKIVMILRFEPGQDDPKSPFNGEKPTRYSDPRNKAMWAKEAGAKGVIIVNGSTGQESRADSLMALKQVTGGGDVGIPIIQMKRRHADTLLGTVGLSVANLQQSIDASYKSVAAELTDVKVRLKINLARKTTKSANVVGLLPGTSKKHAHEVVVVGAHYDHLGYGGEGTGSLFTDLGRQIHNGADDNASGVAGVLELARTLATKRDKVQRSVCFVLFSGEELGLLGSNHFAKSPPFPIEGVTAMINMDMIGRLNADQTLIVMGVGTASVWDHVVDVAAQGLPLKLNTKSDGVGPSDQTSFIAKNIPVLSLFTGVHDDYHKPTDTADKINYPGQMAVLTFASRILEPLAMGEYTPKYQKVAGMMDTEQGIDTMRGFSVYLGTIPDYAVEDRMVLQGVREGGPGWEAGLRAGDQIIRFGTVEVKNVYDYTFALQKYQPGDAVDIVVIRDGEQMSFHLILVGKTEVSHAGHTHNHGEGHFGMFDGEL